MALNMIITEDEKGGYEFFKMLIKHGLFKDAELISAIDGYTAVPDVTEKCIQDALERLNLGQIQGDINIFVLFDTQFFQNNTEKKSYNKAKSKLDLHKQYAEANGLFYVQPNYLSWESLMLTCKELTDICKLGLPYSTEVLSVFNNLHTVVLNQFKMPDSADARGYRIDVNMVVGQFDYETALGSYSAAATTMERRIAQLLNDIAGRQKRRIICISKRQFGKCWTEFTDCDRAEKDVCRNSCYFRNVLCRYTPKERLEYLVYNSFIKDYFERIL